jgi:predicted dehydrogenase
LEPFPISGTLASVIHLLTGENPNFLDPIHPIETMATTATNIGIIGCGTISEAYIKAIKEFSNLHIAGVSDIRPEAAQKVASTHKLKSMSISDLLKDDSVEIVVNLTIPAAHAAVDLQILEAGKHAYAEKPLALSVSEAEPLLELAARKGLRIGSAPDTFLGGGHQTCRALIDSMLLGDVVAGTAFFMCPGHERWHPAPAFYYQIGGGPMLDMGPYYVTALVNLLGPVRSVMAMGSRHRASRIITSQPLAGQSMDVEVNTHVSGTIEFHNGALISMAMSFDVPKHSNKPIELHGLQCSMQVPDPNRFGGPVQVAQPGQDWNEILVTHPFSENNHRGLGVAEMAYALRNGLPHRASGELAFHALEVMQAFETSSQSGKRVQIRSKVARPDPMPTDARWLQPAEN